MQPLRCLREASAFDNRQETADQIEVYGGKGCHYEHPSSGQLKHAISQTRKPMINLLREKRNSSS